MPAVPNPYAKAIRITLIITLVSALAVVALFVLRALHVEPSPFLFVGAPVLLFSAIMLPMLLLVGRNLQRQTQAVVDGGHLAHWTYGDAEWRAFTENEWASERRKAMRLPFQVVGGMLLLGAVMHFIADVPFAEGLLVGAGGGLAVGGIAGALNYSLARSSHRARQATPGEVFIGPSGVFQNGGYTTWRTVGLTLNGVKVVAGDPALLEFEIQSTRGGTYPLHVPIPRGKEHEASRLLGHFGG